MGLSLRLLTRIRQGAVAGFARKRDEMLRNGASVTVSWYRRVFASQYRVRT